MREYQIEPDHFPPDQLKRENKIKIRCLYRMINLHLLVLGYFRELSGGYTCKTILSVYTANIQGHPHFVDTLENFNWSRNLWNVRYVEYFTRSCSLNKSIKASIRNFPFVCLSNFITKITKIISPWLWVQLYRPTHKSGSYETSHNYISNNTGYAGNYN